MSRRRGYISFFDRIGRRRGDTIFYAGNKRGSAGRILLVTAAVAVIVGAWWVLTRPDDRLAAQSVQLPEGVTVPSLLTPISTTTTLAGDTLASEFTCPEPLTTEWSTFQGNSARTGCVQARMIEEPRIDWTVEVGIQGWLNSPVIGGRRVFVGSAGIAQFESDSMDGVYAIDLDTGQLAWKFEASLDVNGVAFANDIVVATGDEGKVWAIDASITELAGRSLWSATRDKAIFGAPLIMDDRVIVGDGDGYVVAYDMSDGRSIWERQVTGAIRGGPASDGNIIVVAGDRREVLAVDRDGTELWRRTLVGRNINANTKIFAAPTIVNGVVVISLVRDDVYADPGLIALDLETGVDLWIGTDDAGLKSEWGNVRASPAAIGDLIISAEPYSQGAVALGLTDGSTRWQTASGPYCYPHWPSPAIVGNQLILARHDGAVYAVDLRSGAVDWSIFLGDSQARGAFPAEYSEEEFCDWGPTDTYSVLASPAVSQDGIIVVGTLEGSIMAIVDQSW